MFYEKALYPVVRTAYKVTPSMAATAFTIPAIAFLIFQYFITKDIPFTKESMSKTNFHSITEKELKINNDFNSKVMPYLEIGDKTGDYKRAISELPEIQTEMLSLVN